jgi:hypothetical protein
VTGRRTSCFLGAFAGVTVALAGDERMLATRRSLA